MGSSVAVLAPVSRATVSAIAGLTSSSVKIVVMLLALHQRADVGELAGVGSFVGSMPAIGTCVSR